MRPGCIPGCRYCAAGMEGAAAGAGAAGATGAAITVLSAVGADTLLSVVTGAAVVMSPSVVAAILEEVEGVLAVTVAASGVGVAFSRGLEEGITEVDSACAVVVDAAFSVLPPFWQAVSAIAQSAMARIFCFIKHSFNFRNFKTRVQTS